MAPPRSFPWDLPLPPDQTVGWVFRAGSNERTDPWMRPGVAHEWSDARVQGKEAGQPVLFLQRGPGGPAWVGWGHVLEAPERWRVYGVRTVCARPIRPPLGVVDPSADVAVEISAEEQWVNRALGTALGLLRYRDRTPYREVGARDFRLTSSDLRQLGRFQPRLRDLIPSVPASFPPAHRERSEGVTPPPEAAGSFDAAADLRRAELAVMDDLRKQFGEEVRFSGLKTALGRYLGQSYWVVEGSFWSNYAPRNFAYAVRADTGELTAKRVDW